MVPESSIAQLVQAFVFNLLDDLGNVIGSWGPVVDPLGNDGYGLRFVFDDDPPLLEEENAGLKIVDGNGNDIRFMWLDGPRGTDTETVPPQIPGVLLGALVDRLMASCYAGNPASNFFPAIIDQVAAFVAIRDGTTPNYTTSALMRAGRTLLNLSGSTAGPGAATLDRDDGGGSQDLASVAAGVLTSPAGWTLDADPTLVRVDGGAVGQLVTVTFTSRNTSGAPIATPVQVATLPAGYRPGATTRFAAAYSSLGAGRIDISTGGAVTFTINGGGNIAAAGYATGSITFLI